MRNHTKVYFDFFNIDYDIPTGWHDYIDCEVCGSQVNDIHHIEKRSQLGGDNIENLIGLCRDCHNKAHAEILKKVDLQRIHDLHVLKHC